MDLTEFLERTGQQVPDPSPAARRLAIAFVERLNAVVPLPWRLRAEGSSVSYNEGERWDGSSDIDRILDQELSAEEGEEAPKDRLFPERINSVAISVLIATQERIAEATNEPWPRLPGGGMA